MAVVTNQGIPKRFAMGEPLQEFDPSGDWTITPSGIMFEEGEVTFKGVYVKTSPKAGKITGQVALRNENDYTALKEAQNVPVIIEDALGRVFSGTMTYLEEGEENLGDGTLPVNLIGTLEQQ